MALAFFATVLTGGRRFAHVERLRSDEVIRTILGVKRLPSAMTLSPYLGAFVRSQIKHSAAMLGEFTWARLSAPPLRGGTRSGLDGVRALRAPGAEPEGEYTEKARRPSHHLILALLAGAKLVLHS
jgi:hypothetical protein